ncbi:hypothetical protein [Bacillus sp. CRN 9]|uniref:hypothetical protein n=1 Tax=Cytobacillus horneckiae TaxID=549687 RepID=UPI00156287EE|nr:hypothetical protein [Bacillus sp. CRN 9]
MPFVKKEKYKQKELKHCRFLNLPELEFINWCSESYKINKGVFHTVDQWFYNYGIESIITRRLFLIAFFDYAAENVETKNKSNVIKFGRGGLNKKLHDFNLYIDLATVIQ